MTEWGSSMTTTRRQYVCRDGTNLMSKGREIRCDDYENHPFERVRDALCRHTLRVPVGYEVCRFPGAIDRG